tara:strand:- start:960 stop:1193 length:234 start_codon:yes stop_codon:yes gene_type:complete
VEESARGREAAYQLSLVQEHLDSRRQSLYAQFCDPLRIDELYELKAEAVALTNLENYLKELVNTGTLAITQLEGESR